MTARATEITALLEDALDGRVLVADSLARYSTYRIGGPATVVMPAHSEDVARAMTMAREHGIPWFALGLGSNVLFPDQGLDALVIRLGKGLDSVRSEDERWWFGAGLPAPLAARKTAAAGYGGIHQMVGVPGTVGGGVFMNAGCHGAEWADVVTRVTTVDDTGRDSVLESSQIPFAYRSSGLGRLIVLEAEVALEPRDPETLEREVRDLFDWRQKGTPFNQPCCGSVFTNPDLPPGGHPSGLRSAGQFIEAAGLKGLTVGRVRVSPMHANYFVNLGGGTADDVRRLMVHAQNEVHDRFGVALVPEVKIITPQGLTLSADGLEDG